MGNNPGSMGDGFPRCGSLQADFPIVTMHSAPVVRDASRGFFLLTRHARVEQTPTGWIFSHSICRLRSLPFAIIPRILGYLRGYLPI